MEEWGGLGIKIEGVRPYATDPDSNFAVVNSVVLPVAALGVVQNELTRGAESILRHVVVQHVSFIGHELVLDGTSANGRDDFPDGLVDATILRGMRVLDAQPPQCQSLIEGLEVKHLFMHEAWINNTSSITNLCQGAWTSLNQGNTYTAVWNVKPLAPVHDLDLSLEARHRYAWGAEIRGMNSGETAVGGRTRFGE